MAKTRRERILEGVDIWTGYYRSNPHRFAADYLHLNLHIFQKILIVMMNWSSTTVFIGSRGIGKSFLSAVFCVIRCILYPGTKICIASGTRGQAWKQVAHVVIHGATPIELLGSHKSSSNHNVSMKRLSVMV